MVVKTETASGDFTLTLPSYARGRVVEIIDFDGEGTNNCIVAANDNGGATDDSLVSASGADRINLKGQSLRCIASSTNYTWLVLKYGPT